MSLKEVLDQGRRGERISERSGSSIDQLRPAAPKKQRESGSRAAIAACRLGAEGMDAAGGDRVGADRRQRDCVFRHHGHGAGGADPDVADRGRGAGHLHGPHPVPEHQHQPRARLRADGRLTRHDHGRLGGEEGGGDCAGDACSMSAPRWTGVPIE